MDGAFAAKGRLWDVHSGSVVGGIGRADARPSKTLNGDESCGGRNRREQNQLHTNQARQKCRAFLYTLIKEEVLTVEEVPRVIIRNEKWGLTRARNYAIMYGRYENIAFILVWCL